MKHVETRALWKPVVRKTNAMIEKGDSLKSAAATLGVNYPMLRYYFLKKIDLEELPRAELKKAESKKIETKVSKNFSKYLEYVSMREDRYTLKEIGEHFNVTTERVRQVLKLFGISGIRNQRPYYKIESQEMLEIDILKKRKAFKLGLSIAEYEKYLQKVPKEIQNRIVTKFNTMSKNTFRVKSLQANVPLMQLTALELLEMYIEKATEMNQGPIVWVDVAKLLLPRSAYIITRRDFSLPYLVDNSFISTKVEFGAVVGDSFGLYSEYRSLKRVSL